jgi:membrane associated rhomboid family serine protease
VRIRYNAPVILSFTLAATAVLVVDQLAGGFVERYFVCPPRIRAGDLLDYLRLFSYVLGHKNWQHLISNFAFVLLIGPVLEEKYRSGPILLMVAATALITGLLNVLLFTTALMGASGVVFMLILLSSFTNIRSGDIPLTFLLVVALFLAKEAIGAFANDDISQFAHILGGFLGSLFGFLFTRRPKQA